MPTERLKDLATHPLVQQQLHRLEQRSRHQHRIVEAGAALDVGDARYAARLVEILPKNWRDLDLAHNVSENDIVVQLATPLPLSEHFVVRVLMDGATDAEEWELGELGTEAGIKVDNWPEVGHMGRKAAVFVHASSKWFRDAPPSVWVKRFRKAARTLALVDAFVKKNKLPLKQGSGTGRMPKYGNVELEIITGKGYGAVGDGTSLYPGRSDTKFRIYEGD